MAPMAVFHPELRKRADALLELRQARGRSLRASAGRRAARLRADARGISARGRPPRREDGRHQRGRPGLVVHPAAQRRRERLPRLPARARRNLGGCGRGQG
jgi:hypothetical protein